METLIEIYMPFIVFIGLAILYLAVFFAIDSIKTTYWLNKNQKAWDKYARGLTFEQRLNIFPDWLEEQRRINGTCYYYIPRIMGKKSATDKEVNDGNTN